MAHYYKDHRGGSHYFQLDASQVKSVYSGRHGCACGCRGNHSETQRSIKLIVGKINALITSGSTPDISITSFGPHIAVDTETRTLCAYLHEAPKEGS